MFAGPSQPQQQRAAVCRSVIAARLLLDYAVFRTVSYHVLRIASSKKFPNLIMDEIQKGWRNLSRKITTTRRRVEESIGSQIRDLNQARQSRKSRGDTLAPTEPPQAQDSLARPPRPPPKDSRTAYRSGVERRYTVVRPPPPISTALGTVYLQDAAGQHLRPHTSGGYQTTPAVNWGQDSGQLRRVSSASRAPRPLSERAFLSTVIELPHSESRTDRRPSTASGPVTQSQRALSMLSPMKYPRRAPTAPDVGCRVQLRTSGQSRTQKFETPEAIQAAWKNDSMFTTRKKDHAERSEVRGDEAIPFAFAKRTDRLTASNRFFAHGHTTHGTGEPAVNSLRSPPAFALRDEARNGGLWNSLPADETIHRFGSDVFDHEVRKSSQRRASSLFDEISKMLLVDDAEDGTGVGAIGGPNTLVTEQDAVQDPFGDEAASFRSATSHAALLSVNDDWENSPLLRRKSEPRRRQAPGQLSKATHALVPSPLQSQNSQNNVSIHRLSKFRLPLRESDWPDQWVPPAPSLVSLGAPEMAGEFDEEWHTAHLEDEMQKLRALRLRMPDEQGVVRRRGRKSLVTDPRVGISFHSSLTRDL